MGLKIFASYLIQGPVKKREQAEHSATRRSVTDDPNHDFSTHLRGIISNVDLLMQPHQRIINDKPRGPDKAAGLLVNHHISCPTTARRSTCLNVLLTSSELSSSAPPGSRLRPIDASTVSRPVRVTMSTLTSLSLKHFLRSRVAGFTGGEVARVINWPPLRNGTLMQHLDLGAGESYLPGIHYRRGIHHASESPVAKCFRTSEDVSDTYRCCFPFPSLFFSSSFLFCSFGCIFCSAALYFRS